MALFKEIQERNLMARKNYLPLAQFLFSFPFRRALLIYMFSECVQVAPLIVLDSRHFHISFSSHPGHDYITFQGPRPPSLYFSPCILKPFLITVFQ